MMYTVSDLTREKNEYDTTYFLSEYTPPFPFALFQVYKSIRVMLGHFPIRFAWSGLLVTSLQKTIRLLEGIGLLAGKTQHLLQFSACWLPCASDMDSETDKVCVRAHMITLLKAGINVVARSFDAKSRDLMVTGRW